LVGEVLAAGILWTVVVTLARVDRCFAVVSHETFITVQRQALVVLLVVGFDAFTFTEAVVINAFALQLLLTRSADDCRQVAVVSGQRDVTAGAAKTWRAVAVVADLVNDAGSAVKARVPVAH
jgi:hypothetical protein